MTLTCSRCGRVGTRGFWVSIQRHPAPNKMFCNNGRACDARVESAIRTTSAATLSKGRVS